MTRLDLIVGPNGAGKSTFVDQVILPNTPHRAFINADQIAKMYWPGHEVDQSYVAAKLAEVMRDCLIRLEEPFIAETVFSHPAKLDLITQALEAGYRVHLHALLVTEDQAVARVRKRRLDGGHDVPEEKIRERYQRLWGHVVAATKACDSATFWDNSGTGPVQVAYFAGGALNGAAAWPEWAPEDLRHMSPPG